jgi:hypothetical protein
VSGGDDHRDADQWPNYPSQQVGVHHVAVKYVRAGLAQHDRDAEYCARIGHSTPHFETTDGNPGGGQFLRMRLRPQHGDHLYAPAARVERSSQQNHLSLGAAAG